DNHFNPFYKAVNYVSAGNFTQAIAEYDRLIEENPDAPWLDSAKLAKVDIMFDTMSLLTDKNDVMDRIEDIDNYLKDILEKHPDSERLSDIYVRLGYINYLYLLYGFAQGDGEKISSKIELCTKYFQKALEADPTNTMALWNYADLLWKVHGGDAEHNEFIGSLVQNVQLLDPSQIQDGGMVDYAGGDFEGFRTYNNSIFNFLPKGTEILLTVTDTNGSPISQRKMVIEISNNGSNANGHIGQISQNVMDELTGGRAQELGVINVFIQVLPSE
ncbi:MAG: hypothetical protein V1843_04160, partial [bacterium]